MKGRTVFASAISDHMIALGPDDIGFDGTVLDHRIVQFANSLALIVAERHSNCVCVAQGIDSLRFLQKALQSEILIGKASVNRTWPYQLEVGVKVVAEDFRSLEKKDILSAYFTIAAIDSDGKMVEIDPIIPETLEQIQRFHDAGVRHQHRNDCFDASIKSGRFQSISV